MPLYDYECNACNHVFEVKQGFNDEPVAACPKCQSSARRIFTPVPIIFKGSGFYVTDHKNAGTPNTSKPSPEREKTAETPKAEAKTETSKQDTKADAGVS